MAEHNNKTSVRLLLHCVDGVVPYLTPHLLRRCFPADQVGSVLSLGLAVRDTCVVPVFEQPQQQQINDSETKKRKREPQVRPGHKPKGYTISASIQPDAWILPYHRVTVPSFDLLQDATKSSSFHRQKLKTNDTELSVTKQQVNIWTINGRLALTPALYQDAVQGLQSHAYVPLYDMIPTIPEPHSLNEQKSPSYAAKAKKRHDHRAEMAVARTQHWLELLQQQQHNDKLIAWIPILIDPNSTDTSLTEAQIEILLEHGQNEQDKHTSSTGQGVALIGWQHQTEPSARVEQLKTVADKLAGNEVSSICVLSTQSLRQVMEIATCNAAAATNCTIYCGTNLPTIWAQEKKAFVVNLQCDSKNTTTEKQQQRKDSSSFSTGLDENGCIYLQTKCLGKDVSSHAWFRDKGPLVKGCQCLTCQTHTRAYVYHLVCAKELLAEILLFIHNLHHMLELLKILQREDMLVSGLVDFVVSQLG